MSDKKRILIIDDDVQLVDTMRTLLESVGYEVSCAYQAEKGLSLAREIQPDLIVADILLVVHAVPAPPGPDGVEVSRRLDQDRILRATPAIVLSGVKKALDTPVKPGPDETYMPVQAFLEKPFRPGELLAEVEQLLAMGDSAPEEALATILVVDDDPDFVTITSRILKMNGYAVMTAANGAQALATMRRQKPDLVLLDIMMSTVLDGLSVSEEMQADPELKDVPVFMVSSITDTEHAAAFPTDGSVYMDGWITKPIQPEGLVEKIRRALRE